LGAEQVLQTLAGFEEYAAAGTLLVLELVGTFVFALTLETLIGPPPEPPARGAPPSVQDGHDIRTVQELLDHHDFTRR
jgi:hypothetical protein